MIVMKFGGTSVQDAKAIERAAHIVRERLCEQPIVVVSALAGVTDTLLEMSRLPASGRMPEALEILHTLRRRHLTVLKALVRRDAESETFSAVDSLFDSVQETIRAVQVLGELTPRTADLVLSTGELLSSRILAAALRAHGISAAWIDSRECIVTDDSHTTAVPITDQTAKRLHAQLPPLFQAGHIPVMGGFIGATVEGISTTLGRGGSDLSASIIGAALNAERVEIWTDVQGIMTTDPRMCEQAQPIDVISFDEATELAYFGAKVLHPATLIPAIKKNIPVFVLNSQNASGGGTCICADAPRSRTTFRAIAAKRGMIVVNVRSPRMLGANGFLRGVFELLERHGSAADLVSTSEVSVSIALQPSRDLHLLLHDLHNLGEVEAEDHKAIVCLVGKDIRGRVGIAARIFEIIAAAGINVHMISQGASEINVGFVIEDDDVPEAVRQLHRVFFEVESLTQSDLAPLAAVTRRHWCADMISTQPEVR
jgi:aspartate kinase